MLCQTLRACVTPVSTSRMSASNLATKSGAHTLLRRALLALNVVDQPFGGGEIRCGHGGELAILALKAPIFQYLRLVVSDRQTVVSLFATPLRQRHVPTDLNPHRRAHPVEARVWTATVREEQQRLSALGVPA
jgi:hypothetical protein